LLDFVSRDLFGESVSMHSETFGRANQVAIITIDQFRDEAFFELRYRLGEQNASIYHLDADGFQAIF
jgi:hypothetical protein